MRKAFDANVSRAKPKLRLGTLMTPELSPESEQEHLAPVETLSAPAPAPSPAPPSLLAPSLSAPPSSPPADALDPRERRERLKERLKAATARAIPAQPTPNSPGEARTSALSLISELRAQLEETTTLNQALSQDLATTRAELGRATEEARSRTEEANRMAAEVETRARLVEELGQELSSLEAERDDALTMLRAARAQGEIMASCASELEHKLVEARNELAETLSEEERIAGELELRNEELRSATRALGALTEERDGLAREVAELSRERASLLESQSALDEIHRALAEARSRVGGTGVLGFEPR